MDIGADANILRRSTVEANNFPSAEGPPASVIFGNGQSSITRDHVTIGQLPAIVCKDHDLQEDLISINPLLDTGFKLTIEADHGVLVNESTRQTIHVRRDGPRWSVDLQDLAQATSVQPQLEANSAVTQMGPCWGVDGNCSAHGFGVSVSHSFMK